jgi:hypothetical protein
MTIAAGMENGKANPRIWALMHIKSKLVFPMVISSLIREA